MTKPDISNLDPGTIVGARADANGADLPESGGEPSKFGVNLGAFRYLKGDLAGGITSGIVALPQTITIGALAFAPLGPEYVTFGILAGFYCAIVSGAVVASFGGTRFGIGGPRSSFSLVMALIISALMAREIDAVGAGIALS